MKLKTLLKIVSKHCVSIRHNKHFVATLPNGRCVTISGTPSDPHFHRQVGREFRKLGVIIPELLAH